MPNRNMRQRMVFSNSGAHLDPGPSIGTPMVVGVVLRWTPEWDSEHQVDTLAYSFTRSRPHSLALALLHVRARNAHRRFNGLQDEIAKQKDDIRTRFEKEKNLYEQIHILEKDIEGYGTTR